MLSLGGYAVPASSGLGAAIGASHSGTTSSNDPNEIVVTAFRTNSQPAGNLILHSFAVGSGSSSATAASAFDPSVIFTPLTALNSTHADGFDVTSDRQADRLAEQIGLEIRSQAEFNLREYGAVIWKDAAGGLHRTSIVAGPVSGTGNGTQTPISDVWSQIDFAGGGRIAAFIHSHPPVYNAASLQNPIFNPAPLSGTLSGGDFRTLIDVSRGQGAFRTGYDNVNFRQYLVTGTGVREFYASDQDVSRYGESGQATWAVQSSDYQTNTSTPVTTSP
jgi:hypothetical protein